MSSRIVINSIPFATHLKQGAKQILARDQARAQKFLQGLHPHGPNRSSAVSTEGTHHRHHHHKKHHQNDAAGAPDGSTGTVPTDPTSAPPAGGKVAPDSIDVTDAGVTYTMSVGVGQPPTQYTLLIDTGSSNTWVGAGTRYRQTSTSKATGNTVNVSYGSGSFSGNEFTDQVTLGDSLVIRNQSIGVATTANGFSDVDGILGIGPVDLTQGTVSNTETVPTVTDNLFKQGTIPTESIGISYEPTTPDGALNGELTFGQVDTSKTTSDVTFVPITSSSPANNYWGIDQTLSYGQDTQLLQSSGIVDTGTTLLLLATDAFQAYQKATGATMDQTTGLLTVTEEQFNNMQSMFFNIGDTTLEFTPNAQIWPRSQNAALGGEAGKIYLITADLGSNIGQGLDFINGFAFLQRFYSVYDTTNAQVGFATTPFTDAETN